MATKKVLVELEVKQTGDAVPRVTREVDKLTAATKKLNYELSDEAKKVAEINVQTELQRKINRKLAVENIKLANSTEEVTESLNQMKTTAGLSGAIVTEFGRTVSDLPYGIRGVGNNLSQLGTLFGLFATNVKNSGRTMSDGFKELFGQMKGVIGIMTAFQIVLAAAQSEWFQKWVSGLFDVNNQLGVTKDKLKELSSEVRASALVANRYVDVLEDVSTSEKDRAIVTQELIDLIPTLTKEDLAYGNNLEKVRGEIRKYSLAQASRLEIDKLVEENSSSLAKKQEIENIKSIKDAKERSERVQEFLENETSWYENNYESTVSVIDLQRKAFLEGKELNFYTPEFKDKRVGLSDRVRKSNEQFLKDITDFEKDLDKKVEPVLKRINELTGDLILDASPKGNLKKTTKIFKEGLLDLSKLEERFRQESKKSEIKTEEELINQKAEFAKRDLELTLKNFKEKERIRLNNFIEKQELRKKEKGVDVDAIDKSITEAKRQSSETIKAKRKESKYVIKQIEAVADAEKTLLTRREAERARAQQEEVDRRKRARDISTASDGVLGVDDNRADAIQAEIDYQKLLVDATKEGTIERFNAEQAYYEARKMLAEEDLSQENIIIEQKKNTQEQYLDFMSVISSGLRAISDNNKGWQKASLVFEKSIAIGGVVSEAAKSIGTSTAATQAANQLIIAKYASVPAPFGTIAAAKEIKANTALHKKGVVQTKTSAATSIASITAGALSGLSASGSSGGGGAGATTVQPPDFNIIGSTGVNQLAEAIGSTEKEPLRAYVVSSDITTKQALDRNIRSSAEL